MKYVIAWERSPNATEQTLARSLEVFGKWSPNEGVTFLQFLGRVDSRGGFAVVETDDPALISKDITPFGAWFDFTIHPVLEIADSAAIGAEAVAFLASVS